MKITKRQLRRIIRESIIINEAPTLTRTGMSKGGGGPMVGLPKKSRDSLVKEIRPQLDAAIASGKTKGIPQGWIDAAAVEKIHDKDPKFSLYMPEDRGGPTDEELMALQKALNPTIFGKFKKMFGFKESVHINQGQLRKIIRKNIIGEQNTNTFHSRRSIPRSVQADYDIANKEDTFPKAKPPKGPSPELKASYEMINKEMTKVLQGMPGYKSILYGEGAYVDAKRKEVVEMLKPIATKIGAEVKEGHADETFIRHPDGVMVTIFGSGTGTEVDFGPTPGS